MTLKFTSLNDMFQDERARIEFVVPYTKGTYNEEGIQYEVFEFIDPKSKQLSRFEFSQTKINLFTGPSSLLFELNKKIPNEYTIQDGDTKFKAYLYTRLTLIEYSNTLKNFSYILFDKDREIGNIKISLEILD